MQGLARFSATVLLNVYRIGGISSPTMSYELIQDYNENRRSQLSGDTKNKLPLFLFLLPSRNIPRCTFPTYRPEEILKADDFLPNLAVLKEARTTKSSSQKLDQTF